MRVSIPRHKAFQPQGVTTLTPRQKDDTAMSVPDECNAAENVCTDNDLRDVVFAQHHSLELLL
jgi:hypothetical protein